ncbi:MAG: chromophore lyase CpcT/CpeT [Winogradskyella sp.]|uniref:chromophore lyase CpcT/CpeT n=1 Tax=Winogradskyella sp. TaxID=1883156 RepID=UPI0025F4D2CE|nr:chromophore lyase CpcT/CpeT [Winogradskyella sp.]NRB58430.1 hypothetical protein [Winogradskyella sp.]
MKRIIPLFLIVTILLGCKSVKTNSKEDRQLEELFSLMQGSFNSEKQAKADSTYYNISLHMYPIWKDKGHFLYVEQALNSMQNRPYRQRIYEVTRTSDGNFSSAVYKLNVDSLWIGKWETPKDFDAISLEDIALKEGCEVVLKRLGDKHFKGKTGDDTCISTMRGASYARSEVEITENKVISWDRGFDADGNYVWGAEFGPYIFDKLD